VRKAGGTVERTGKGRLQVTGPDGSVTIQEPSGETRRDLRRSSAGRLIEERTGLKLP
jgi:outer membrane biogenesis lipoprotein LolB